MNKHASTEPLDLSGVKHSLALGALLSIVVILLSWS